jgi:hypothetical protein
MPGGKICVESDCYVLPSETNPSHMSNIGLGLKKALPGGNKMFMFGLAAVWALWKARNKSCFEKKPI